MTYDEPEYVRLLEILYRVIQAMEGETLDPDKLYHRAEGLAAKLFMHAASALYLARGTRLPEFPPEPIDFPDFASTIVVARAAWEAFLVFSYLLVLPQSEEERDLRYLSYQIGGLSDTLSFPALSPEAKEQQRRAKDELEKLRGKLESNTLFQALEQKARKNLLKGYWRPRDWRWSRIAKESGIAEFYATHGYSVLSVYAHPTDKSILAIQQTKTREQQQKSLAAAMELVKIAMANVIHGYCGLFARAGQLLESEPGAEQLVRSWLELGRQEIC